VVGILIALQIQTWNEGRRDAFERKQLVAEMIVDFQASQERLKKTFDELKSRLTHGNEFLFFDPMHESIPVATLRINYRGLMLKSCVQASSHILSERGCQWEVFPGERFVASRRLSP
jgi:hypothetical protein